MLSAERLKTGIDLPILGSPLFPVLHLKYVVLSIMHHWGSVRFGHSQYLLGRAKARIVTIELLSRNHPPITGNMFGSPGAHMCRYGRGISPWSL